MTSEPAIIDLETEIPGLSVIDKENPRSVINIVSEQFQRAIERVPRDLFERSETELRRYLKPSETCCRLRISFWHAYHRAQGLQRTITNNGVTAGICSKEYFERYVLKDPKMIAWILCPPASYEASLQESLNIGLQKIREVLMLDLYEEVKSEDPETGEITYKRKVDYKAADLILKAFMLVDVRVKGSVVQKHQIEQKNLNMNLSPSDTTRLLGASSMEDVEKRISELTKKHKALSLAQEEAPLAIQTRDTPSED